MRKTPDNTQKTLLIFGAHPDDNELAGGTLAKFKLAGWRIVSVVLTDGRFIGGTVAEQNIRIRENESLRAAERLGCEVVFLRFREGDLQPTPAVQRAVLQEIRKARPAIIITHPDKDYHPDHMTTSACVEAAVRQSSNPCVETEAPPCAPPLLYYRDAWFTPFVPDVYVDITATMDLKIELISFHKSQLVKNGNGDLLNMAKIQSRVRGIEAGVEYAEAFRLVPNLGSVRMGELLI